MVGINATRALTCKYNAQLSCGRVQTPTLAMIAAREEEIRTFKPVPYYGLKAAAGGITFTWTDARSGSSRSFDKDRIQAIKQASAPSLLVTDVRKKLKKTFAPALYDLTALQREANQKFGFSAKQTLNIMQRLYENHKVLTYPRTDSRYLTTDIVPTLKERLKACAVGPYSKIAGRLSMQKLQANKSFVNDSKVSDHHAIIPTEQFVQLDHMSNEERKIYDFWRFSLLPASMKRLPSAAPSAKNALARKAILSNLPAGEKFMSRAILTAKTRTKNRPHSPRFPCRMCKKARHFLSPH